MKQHLVRIALGLAITLFFIGHAARVYQVGLITQLDNIIYDTRLRVTMPRGVDPRIVILDIDEKSLGEIGRWPWGRNLMAQLIEKLFDRYGVAVLGFDVVWAERDTSSGIRTLDALAEKDFKQVPVFQDLYRRIRPTLDNDGLFARAMQGRPVVLGYYFNSEERAVKANAIPEPVLPKGTFAGRNIAFTRWVGYTGNLPEYLKNAAAAGHFNPLVDFDGVSRRVPMILEYDGAYYESLSLAMVRVVLGMPKVEPGYPPERFLTKGYGGLEWIKVGPVTVPVDDTASALIPYRGRKFSYPYISLTDVIHDRVKPEQLRGKIALVGTTAPGLLDLRSTPVDSVFPGVEIHANLIAGMLDKTLKEKPPFMLGAEVILLIIGGVTLSILIPMLSALWATAAAIVGIGSMVGLNVAVWSKGDMVLPLATSVLMTGALYVMNMAYGYFVESRSKRQFTELFGQYVPPELVDRMAADPSKYNMEPRSAELTILFSDVRGFTSISEALKPEELREYINEYLTNMSSIIRSRYRGTLDKYIGDAIMAFWGAPVEDTQHARNGVLAGLEMQKECDALNARFSARGWPTLKIGVGLNSGTVRVGDMGSQVRRAYTAMGDAVNVASRLEGRTKAYSVGVLVGEATRNLVKDVVFREVDRIKVKGKDEAISIYEPLGLESEIGNSVQEELKLWNQALRAYRTQQWDQADLSLLNLSRMNPGCGLYKVYADRVAEKRRAPPPSDWDGVTAFDEK
ncbi:MAG: guanylate cyclase [Betaproteobacteria bacterium RIFCSPLOWO2_12_FULL_65_14]|nr:MAG: guanylate cyclase [Betaproteobacteria bacterium RIFCSPLOWO2_12_FULL_65_14]